MSPFLDDCAEILADESSLGLTVNTNLFLAKREDDPDTVVVLYEYAGEGRSFIGSTKAPGLQVTARSKSYTTARAQIELIDNYLSSIGNEQIDDAPEGIEKNGTFYLRFAPVQNPFPLGEDEQGRQTIVINFIVTKRS